ncbi:MAG: RluA family pseudouridine synthase [Bdellovibrionales bacterium]|nr:RluA family pseudouridine synthase [Bdellovibrionales bacterium]
MAGDDSLDFSVSVTEPQAGQRIDKFLSTQPSIGSRTKAENLIEAGHVQVNGKTVKPSYKVQFGDNVSVQPVIQATMTEVRPAAGTLDIVLMDDSLIIINKPAGLVVHPAPGHWEDTLVNRLKAHELHLSSGSHPLRPGIVHRLDKDTSGLLVIAKTDDAHRKLAAQFQNRTSHRIYWAFVYGTPKNKGGRIESLLARHPTDRKRIASSKTSGKRAITNYKIIRAYPEGISLLELKLETGRTHQIRVHLSEMGHPIVGDSLYGAIPQTKRIKDKELREKIESMNRIALHAAQLGFVHPRTEKNILHQAPWPQDLEFLVSLGSRSQ